MLGVVLLVLLIAILYGHRDLPLSVLMEKYAQSPSSFISIDNMDVHYRDEGKLTNTLPVVLIHGTAASLHTFDDWTAELKNDFRVVRMDLPAFGLSGPFPHRQYTIENYVVFLEHFLSAKGINKCILGGNSLGGEIAWRFTVKNPALVDKLILIIAAGYQYESEREPIAFAIGRIPYTDKIIEYLDESINLKKPFFSYVAFTAPHWPLQVPDEHIDLYKGRYSEGYEVLAQERFNTGKQLGIINETTLLPPLSPNVIPWAELSLNEQNESSQTMEVYAAMVERLDANIGKLIDHLKSRGQYDNTIIIFMADNGAEGNSLWGAGDTKEWIEENYDNSLANIGRRESYVFTGPSWAQVSSLPFKWYKKFFY